MMWVCEMNSPGSVQEHTKFLRQHVNERPWQDNYLPMYRKDSVSTPTQETKKTEK
jgi:hypothetical protein